LGTWHHPLHLTCLASSEQRQLPRSCTAPAPPRAWSPLGPRWYASARTRSSTSRYQVLSYA